MTLEIQHVTIRKELQFPIMMLKVMTVQDTKEYHLKRLYDLSIKLLVIFNDSPMTVTVTCSDSGGLNY